MMAFTTKNGIKVTIRKPLESDAAQIIDFAHLIFRTSDQVLTTPAEFTNTVEQEQAWIRNYNQSPTSLILVAESEGQIIGMLDFAPRPRKKVSHTGEFGISIHPDLRGEGIGSRMIRTMLNWARQTGAIEKVLLRVFSSNERAIALYKREGFTEEGKEIKAVKQPDGSYTDIIQMYIFL